MGTKEDEVMHPTQECCDVYQMDLPFLAACANNIRRRRRSTSSIIAVTCFGSPICHRSIDSNTFTIHNLIMTIDVSRGVECLLPCNPPCIYYNLSEPDVLYVPSIPDVVVLPPLHGNHRYHQIHPPLPLRRHPIRHVNQYCKMM